LENLGTDSSKININSLEKKYKQEIRKSYKTIKTFLESEKYYFLAKEKKLRQSPFLTKEQLIEIEAINIHYQNKFMKIEKETRREFYELFLIKFAVSSTSIEGNTINLLEAERLLMRMITPKNKTLREVYDLQNTKNVFFDLLDNLPDISVDLIAKVHDDLLQNIDSRKGYRNHEIRILGQPFSPSPVKYIKTDMNMLLDWYVKNRDKIPPIVLATFFHHKFEHIHPFSDGNGRTGRIIMNLMLFKQKCPPIIIPVSKREEYLDFMNKGDTALKKNILSTDIEHYEDLISFIVGEYQKSYWNTFLV